MSVNTLKSKCMSCVLKATTVVRCLLSALHSALLITCIATVTKLDQDEPMVSCDAPSSLGLAPLVSSWWMHRSNFPRVELKGDKQVQPAPLVPASQPPSKPRRFLKTLETPPVYTPQNHPKISNTTSDNLQNTIRTPPSEPPFTTNPHNHPMMLMLGAEGDGVLASSMLWTTRFLCRSP